jgi:ABC-type dipeptide/oligopeptide/nickel transport system permease component/ABC-type transport system substrate-binding protein
MPRPASPKLRFTLKFAAGCVAAALGLTGLVWATAAFFRPDLTRQPESRTEAEICQARQARNPRLTPKQPPVIVQPVDYLTGSRAAWWPKGEAPVLAALVQEGKLPPVAERTGPEPVVMAGMESAVGRYGGTWHRLATNPEDIEGVIRTRLSYSSLVRWSPQGYPIVPHLAKSWSSSPDQREWTFTLREGLRWSDGAPFTTDDIMFWWEWEALYFRSENVIFHSVSFMRHTGQLGRLEQVDKHTVKFIFEEPHSFFLEKMASSIECFRPAHYLRKYHPALGEPQLHAELMKAMNLPSPEAVYQRLLGIRNPEHPRMWPWVYMDYRSSAPQGFVRNPYYYAVDPQGNQLPYLDRVLFDIKNRPMITAAIAGGELTFQDRHIDFEDYTLLSSETKRRGYTLRHWYYATRTMAQIGPNLNRIVKPDEPESAWKKKLLNERDFRRALSLAINRQEIIDAVFNGVGAPGQSSPGPDSPYYNDRHFHSYAAYEPATANTLLDGLGLTGRDREGFRTYPDGTRMTWFLNLAESFPPDTAHMIATHWQQVGLRTTVQIHPRTLWQVKQAALEHDFTFWPGLEEFMPMIDPRYYAPVNGSSFFAPAWGRWYAYGGLRGHPDANKPGLEGPPPGHPARRAQELYDLAQSAPSVEARIAYFNELLEIAADNVWSISVSTSPPLLASVQDGFRNVPDGALAGYYYMTPGNMGLETYFWDKANDQPVVIERLKAAIANPSKLPLAGSAPPDARERVSAGRLLAWGLWLTLGLGFVMLAVRHPFIWRRLLTLVPTLLIISIIVYTIVQLPPGDFIASKTAELSLNGDPNAASQLEDIRRNFHLDDPAWKQYARWMGFKWFLSFDAADTGILQGNLGRSMENNLSVNEILGDRILLTFLISLFTILFTWAVALPIGIYSAVRPYTLGDYVLTLVGFMGMSVPPFLFALVLMYISGEYFGVSVSGLFSVRYASDPVWSWGKIVDLLQHVWVAVVVLGAGSTAVMIRVMRANLLDELKKPYVVAARAKGVRPLKLLLKYPVRMALNPFASGLAALFPQLVSGGAIVALVLSLPTIGPVLLQSLLNEDTYFAASMLMLLSVLGALGTLVSDLILLWLDPRIRLGGGSD